jgi:hypothetical protein
VSYARLAKAQRREQLPVPSVIPAPMQLLRALLCVVCAPPAPTLLWPVPCSVSSVMLVHMPPNQAAPSVSCVRQASSQARGLLDALCVTLVPLPLLRARPGARRAHQAPTLLWLVPCSVSSVMLGLMPPTQAAPSVSCVRQASSQARGLLDALCVTLVPLPVLRARPGARRAHPEPMLLWPVPCSVSSVMLGPMPPTQAAPSVSCVRQASSQARGLLNALCVTLVPLPLLRARPGASCAHQAPTLLWPVPCSVSSVMLGLMPPTQAAPSVSCVRQASSQARGRLSARSVSLAPMLLLKAQLRVKSALQARFPMTHVQIVCNVAQATLQRWLVWLPAIPVSMARMQQTWAVPAVSAVPLASSQAQQQVHARTARQGVRHNCLAAHHAQHAPLVLLQLRTALWHAPTAQLASHPMQRRPHASSVQWQLCSQCWVQQLRQVSCRDSFQCGGQ